MQVNSTFYEAAGPLLYREVRINRNGFASFADPGPVPTCNIPRDGNVYRRTSQLELLKYTEVIEVGPHWRCWNDAPTSHERAVRLALARVPTLPLICPEDVSRRATEGNSETWCRGPWANRSCLLNCFKPVKLVVYAFVGRATRDPMLNVSISILVANDISSLVIVVPAVGRCLRHSGSSTQIYHNFARQIPVAVILGGRDEAINRRAMRYIPPPKDSMSLCSISKAIGRLQKWTSLDNDYFYVGQHRSKLLCKLGLQTPILSGQQVTSYMKKRKMLPTGGRAQSIKVYMRDEYLARDRLHEIPEDLMVERQQAEAEKALTRADTAAKKKHKAVLERVVATVKAVCHGSMKEDWYSGVCGVMLPSLP